MAGREQIGENEKRDGANVAKRRWVSWWRVRKMKVFWWRGDSFVWRVRRGVGGWS
jgi:hypothetical protein